MTAPRAPQDGQAVTVLDHSFYRWGEPDDFAGVLCGIGCGKPPEAHISPEAFADRERLRDAAPQLVEALESYSRARQHNTGDDAECDCDGDCEAAYELWLTVERLAIAALAAARPVAGEGA